MAYDRYERRGWRDERSGPSNERDWRGRNHDRDERGFFERAGDEIASWFGDDDAERRRDRDEAFRGRDYGERGRQYGRGRDDFNLDRGRDRLTRMDRDDDRSYGSKGWSSGPRDIERGYRTSEPRTYGATAGGYGAMGRDPRADYDRGDDWDRDDYRRTSFAGSSAAAPRGDTHYASWRQRQMDELDRDYDEYRSENQSRFEEDFSNWRSRRQDKRRLLGRIREHMEVVGNDDEHVGTVDRVAGDRIILTKSDPEAGGVHHSITCTMIERVDDKVVLDVDADKARQRWRDESRERALFEREDQGRAGPHILDRSFSGTYR